MHCLEFCGLQETLPVAHKPRYIRMHFLDIQLKNGPAFLFFDKFYDL